ncbi:MAG: ArsR/SmtB family transcription factor [Oscillospiraceae bacterium]
MKIELSRTPDPVWEVCSILESAAAALDGEREPYTLGIKDASEYYINKLGLSKSAGKELFAPLFAVEGHVLKGLSLSEQVLRKYFYVPVSTDHSSFGCLVAAMRDLELTREEAADFILGTMEEDGCGDISFPDFVKRIDELSPSPDYAWSLCSSLADWENSRCELSDIFERGKALFQEKEELLTPLIDQWYCELTERLKGGRLFDVLSYSGGLQFPDYDGTVTVFPYIERFSSIALTLYKWESKDGRRTFSDFAWRYGLFAGRFSEHDRKKNDKADKLQKTFKALGDKQRIKIISALLEGPKFTSDIISLSGLSPATVTHHMQELLSTGLINLELSNNRTRYSISKDSCRDFVRDVQAMFCAGDEAR